MDRRKKFFAILIIILFIIVLLVAFAFLSNKKSEDINRLIIPNENVSSLYGENSEETIIEENYSEKEEIDDGGEEDICLDDGKYNENEVVDYFSNIKDEVIYCDDIDKFKDEFKKYFVMIVDFIFYDTEINGYRFNELANENKVKIISYALIIDNKLEEFFPKYKEFIVTNGEKTYNNIKERLISLYFDISSKICNKNVSGCIEAKKIFVDIKNDCNIGVSFIKNMIKNGSLKVKDWYEIYSDK